MCCDKCEKEVYCKGLCRTHYRVKNPWKSKKLCSINNCKNLQFAKKLCSKHYSREHRKNAEVRQVINTNARNRRTLNLYTCREKEKQYNYLPSSRFTHAKWQANKRKLLWTITYDEYIVLIDSKCYYCNQTLPKAGCGLDRIDNLRGYELDNVIPCCSTCNMARGKRYTVSEFKAMMEALIMYRLTIAKSEQAKAAADNPAVVGVKGGDNTSITSSTTSS